MTTKLAFVVLVISLAFVLRERLRGPFVLYRDEVLDFRPMVSNSECFRALPEAGKQEKK